jgi:ribosomal protection tetracycline resistance protein
MGTVRAPGSRAADFEPWGADDDGFRMRLAEALAERDDGILAAYVEEGGVPRGRLFRALAKQTGGAVLHPVFFGSAMTGAGVEALTGGIAELLPARVGDPAGDVAGSVFKIERGDSGEKVAYVRMFSGAVSVRDRVSLGRGREGRVTAISVFGEGVDAGRPSVRAGEIARVWGLREVQIGDPIGETRATAAREFAPPTLEAVVSPDDPDDGAPLRVALAQLAEQDPLIDVRQDDRRGEISVSLYGEVQKEVLQAMLADDYGIAVGFRETTTIHVERPVRVGEAVEVLHGESNPFLATVGLRVEPGSGFDFRLAVDARRIPIYAYRSGTRFGEHMADYVRTALAEGLHGWQVTDCTVTMTDCNYSSPDGPPATRGPLSPPADFRKLTPLVLMRALERAGTVVCEPVLRVSLEVPVESLGAVLPLLARHDAELQPPSLGGRLATIEALLPAARVHDVQRELPSLTGGEGTLESEFAGYHPVGGDPPSRRRTTPNPLSRDEYLMHLAGRVSGK